MAHVWRVTYRAGTAHSSGRIWEEKTGLFITASQDLAEIREAKTVDHGWRVYCTVEILEAEYIGEAEDLRDHGVPVNAAPKAHTGIDDIEAR